MNFCTTLKQTKRCYHSNIQQMVLPFQSLSFDRDLLNEQLKFHEAAGINNSNLINPTIPADGAGQQG